MAQTTTQAPHSPDAQKRFEDGKTYSVRGVSRVLEYKSDKVVRHAIRTGLDPRELVIVRDKGVVAGNELRSRRPGTGDVDREVSRDREQPATRGSEFGPVGVGLEPST